ncbi:MAG: zinc ribbon domain-containing protein [Victivallales bacterium]|nr:zinc ribbon domain-containing protein [Victivallales bacterium]
MPIYEYECQKCGKVFSHLHRRLNDAAPACPECGASDVKKKFSSFSAKVQTSGCAHADSCPSGGHQCCPGCCHNH